VPQKCEMRKITQKDFTKTTYVLPILGNVRLRELWHPPRPTLRGCTALCNSKLHRKLERHKSTHEVLGETRKVPHFRACKTVFDLSTNITCLVSFVVLCAAYFETHAVDNHAVYIPVQWIESRMAPVGTTRKAIQRQSPIQKNHHLVDHEIGLDLEEN